MGLPLFGSTVQEKLRSTTQNVTTPTVSLGEFDFPTEHKWFDEMPEIPKTEALAGVPKPPQPRESGTANEFLGRLMWGALDSATFNALRWATDDKSKSLADTMMGEESGQTRAGMWGEGIGQAAGFLVPFGTFAKGGKVLVSSVGKYGSKNVAKKITDEIAEATAKKASVQFTTKSGSIMKGPKYTEELARDKFLKIMDKQYSGKKVMNHYADGMKSVAERNVFRERVTKNFAENLQEEMAKSGLRLDGATAKAIESTYAKFFTKAETMPVSSIAGAIQRFMAKRVPGLGWDSKLASAGSLMMEEAILFAGVESMFEGINASQNDREAHYGETISHAAKMGMMLGAVRLIPGGKKGYNKLGLAGPLSGAESGFGGFRKLILNREPYKNRINHTVEKLKGGGTKPTEDTQALFEVFNMIQQGGQTLKGSPVKDILMRSAKDNPWVKKGIFGGKSGKNSVSISNFDAGDIERILGQSGSGWRTIGGVRVNQKEVASQIMADGLDDVFRNFKTSWQKNFFKEYAEDFLRSSPRMVIGGITMAGGPGIVMDENIEFVDKVYHIALGGFMMKHGKQLKWYGKDGRAIEGSQFFGKAQPWGFHEKFKEQTAMMELLGGNPKDHYMWQSFKEQMEGKPLVSYLDSVIRSSKETKDILKVKDEFLRESKGKNIYFTEGTPKEIKDNSEIANNKENKDLYEIFVSHGANNFMPAESPKNGNVFSVKKWEHLTNREKKNFIKKMKEKNVKSSDDYLDIIIDSNIDVIHDIQNSIQGGLVSALQQKFKKGTRGEEDGAMWMASDTSDGKIRLPKIDAETTGSKKLSESELQSVVKYNQMVDFLHEAGRVEIFSKNAQDTGTKVNMDSPRLGEFLSSIESVHKTVQEKLGLGGSETHEIALNDPVFVTANRFFNTHNNIKTAESWIGKVMYDKNVGNRDITFEGDTKQEAKSLLRKIFYASGDGRTGRVSELDVVHDLIKVDKKTKQKDGDVQLSREQEFVDSLHEIIKFHGTSRLKSTGSKAKEFHYPEMKKDVRRLQELMQQDGITLFSHWNQGIRNEFVDNLKKATLKQKLQGQIRNSDGTVRDVEASDIDNIVKLMDSGLVNENLTLLNVKGIWGDVSGQHTESLINSWRAGKRGKPIQGVDNNVQLEFNKFLDDILLAEKADRRGRTDKQIKDEIQGIAWDTFKQYQEAVEPYVIKNIKDKNGDIRRSGILHLNKTQEVFMDRATLISINAQMHWANHNKKAGSVENFINDLRDASKSENIEMRNFATRLLRNFARSDADYTRALELANRYKLYDSGKRKFNEAKAKIDGTFVEPSERMKLFLTQVARPTYGSKKQVEANYDKWKDIETLENGNEGFHQENMSTISQKYNFFGHSFKDGSEIISYGEQSVVDQLHQIHDGYVKSNGTIDTDGFIRDLRKAAEKNGPKDRDGDKFSDKELSNLDSDLNKLRMDIVNSETIPLVTINTDRTNREGSHYHDLKNKVKTTPVTLGIRKILEGVEMPSNHMLGDFVMIERDIMTDGNKYKPISGDGVRADINKQLYDAERTSTTKDMKIVDESGVERPMTQEQPNRKVLYSFGSSKQSFGIVAERGSLNAMAGNYLSFLRGLKRFKGKEGEAELQAYLNETFGVHSNGINSRIKIVEKDGEVRIESTKEDGHINAESAQQAVKNMIDDRIFIDVVGADFYFNNIKTLDAKSQSTLNGRLSLFNNMNSNTLSKEILTDISKYQLDFAKKGDTQALSNAKALKDLADGKFEMKVFRDEFAPEQMKKEVHHMLNEQIKHYENELADPNLPKDLREGIIADRDVAKELLADKSGMDGFTLVNPRLFDALASIMGAGAGDHIGAIKPIMLRHGDQFFVNKTAFQKDATYSDFFKANENLGMVTFTSASKSLLPKNQAGESVYHPWFQDKIIEVNQSKSLMDYIADPAHAGKAIKIRPEDIQLMQVKGFKDKAKMAVNHALGMEGEARKDFIKKHLMGKWETNGEAILKLVNHEVDAIAFNQLRNRDMYDSLIDTETAVGVSQRFANEGLNPWAMPNIRSWQNILKSHFIDPIANIETNGTIATLSPDMQGRLRGTIMVKGNNRSEIYRMGESSLPHESRNQKFNPSETMIIDAIGTAKGSDKGQMITAKEYMDKHNLKAETLGELYDAISGPSTTAPKKGGRVEFTTELGSTYVVDGTTTRRTKVPKTGKGPGLKERSTVTMYMSEMSAKQAFGQPFGAMQVSGAKKIEFGELGVTINGKTFSAQNKPKKGLLPVEFMQGDTGTSYHVGHKIIKIGTEQVVVPAKHNKSILVAWERNPHTKPDSVVLLRLKDFKAAEDGANGQVAFSDGRRGLEFDHDLDTGKARWDLGKNVAEHYYNQRGRVADSQARKGVTSVNEKMDIFKAEEHQNRLSQEHRGDLMKGIVMKTQRVIDHVKDMVNRIPNEDKLIHLGGNRYAKFRTDRVAIDEKLQQLANDIQGVLDSKKGYDSDYYADMYSTDIGNKFLFGPDGLFQPYVKNKVDGGIVVEQSGRFTEVDLTALRAGIIDPINRLARITSADYSQTGKREQVSFDAMMTAIEYYNGNMRWQHKVIQKALEKAGLGGTKEWSGDGKDYAARFMENGEKASMLLNLREGDLGSHSVFERQMSLMYDLGRKARIRPPANRNEPESTFMNGIESMTHNKDVSGFMTEYGKSIKDTASKLGAIDMIERKIKSTQELVRESSLHSDFNGMDYFRNRLERLKSVKKGIQDKLKYKIDSDGNSIRKDNDGQWKTQGSRATNLEKAMWKAVIREKRRGLLNRALKKADGNREKELEIFEKFEKDNKDDALVMKELEKNGIEFTTMGTREMISAVAMQKAFGTLSNVEMFMDAGSNVRQLHHMTSFVNRQAREMREYIDSRWNDFNNSDKPNELATQVAKDIQASMEQKFLTIFNENPDMAKLFIFKVMTPEINYGKLVKAGNRMMFAPKNANHHRFATAGFKFFNETQQIPEAMKQVIFKDMTEVMNSAYREIIHPTETKWDYANGVTDILEVSFNGNGELTHTLRKGQTADAKMGSIGKELIEETNIFYQYDNPLMYNSTGLVSDVVREVNPNLGSSKWGAEYSQLTQYEMMRKVFGTGGIREAISKRSIPFFPSGAIDKMTKHGHAYGIGGMADYRRAIEREATGLLGDLHGKEGLLGEGSNMDFNTNVMLGRHKKARDVVKEQIDKLCNK